MRAVKLDAFAARLHAIHMQRKTLANVNVVVGDASASLLEGVAGADTAALANPEPTFDTSIPLPDDDDALEAEAEYDDDDEADDDDDDGLGGYGGVTSTASAFEVNSVSTDCRTCGHDPLPVDSSPATLANEIDMLKQRITELETKLQDL